MHICLVLSLMYKYVCVLSTSPLLTLDTYALGILRSCECARNKVLCQVIQNRMKKRENWMLRELPCGFRPGRGCVDKVFVLCALIEKAREFHTPFYLCFIDLTKAYDS